MKRLTAEEAAKALLCSTEGCARPWSSDIPRRLCIVCSGGARQILPPLTEPARPFNELAERDEDTP